MLQLSTVAILVRPRSFLHRPSAVGRGSPFPCVGAGNLPIHQKAITPRLTGLVPGILVEQGRGVVHQFLPIAADEDVVLALCWWGHQAGR